MKENYYIMGKNCLEEMLTYASSRIVRVFTSQAKQGDPLLNEIQKKKIPISYLSKDALSSLVDSESHQCFVAQVKKRESLNIDLFLNNSETKEKSCILALDSIFDPQNLGTLLRASECFQVDAVLFSKNRGADITPVATKTSCGASELVPLLPVSNLADVLLKLQKEGFSIVLADVNPAAESLFSFSFPDKMVLVMGSEGEGVRQRIQKMANHHVYIPMLGKISSLNVSQATAVFLYAWKEYCNKISHS